MSKYTARIHKNPDKSYVLSKEEALRLVSAICTRVAEGHNNIRIMERPDGQSLYVWIK